LAAVGAEHLASKRDAEQRLTVAEAAMLRGDRVDPLLGRSRWLSLWPVGDLCRHGEQAAPGDHEHDGSMTSGAGALVPVA